MAGGADGAGEKYARNSEGLDNYVLFSYPLRDSSACLIQATVQAADGSPPISTYLQPTRDGKGLALGWFTCGGDIHFTPEAWYTVRFEAVDAAGNRTPAGREALPFQAPAADDTGWPTH